MQASEENIKLNAMITDIDSQLIKEYQKSKDLNSFTQIMNKYKKKVFNYCLKYLGCIEDAEDVTQEIFIKVFRNAKSFRAESKFSTWLYTITFNTCCNHKRKFKFKLLKEVTIESQNEEADSSKRIIVEDSLNPEDELLNKELGYLIKKAILKLKKRQRAVLILKDYHNKQYQEIAEILGINIGTVKSSLSRARLNVAKQIKDNYKNEL